MDIIYTCFSIGIVSRPKNNAMLIMNEILNTTLPYTIASSVDTFILDIGASDWRYTTTAEIGKAIGLYFSAVIFIIG